MKINPEELETCLRVLQEISENTELINNHERFKSLIAKIYKNGKKIVRRNLAQEPQQEDKKIKNTTAIVKNKTRQQPSANLPSSFFFKGQKLSHPIPCYICKQPYTDIHFFYHSLCPICAEFNYHKRHQRTNLKGRVALITGGRIKIGYQTALRLLKDGAKVIVTTRFPHDAAKGFSSEVDFGYWRDRLQIYGLDLRNLGAVENLVRYLFDTEKALDIIINNAAQTIKRPLAFYQHLLEGEKADKNFLPLAVEGLITSRINSAPLLLESYGNYPGHLTINQRDFPPQIFDEDGQQLDRRSQNSWRLKLDQVSSVEMLEVQLVNAVAPFILNSQLKPLLIRSQFERRFIINVSAMEGQFNRKDKTVHHPHTNMAKAALNMMTRTSAADYATDGIFMNSVDTGWITDENPYPKKMYLQEKNGFYPPLDIIDGMARVYDPIVQGIEQEVEPLSGFFLKDYHPYPW
ncbi:SDR family NAD(P)-dependent oxidoreductase [Gloeothece verrucosa]|uniref:Short-chain dehydrogenase/reductase SDR n=1 Tax=Gloeothece verrucosa (strain PCC 7822) TaxID=497965 RepID=E0UHH7_GLOV7|nr:SDR family oxidoreductase [Gloeothece verrucosa]ADN12118.1 conserved hypothetical protein [Gloeothece verrucosa PCC 7822]